MSKLEHTPGPWLIEGRMLPNRMSAVIVYGDGVWIASVNGDHNSNSSRPVGGFPSNDEGNANARLIAAAPELLACVKVGLERLALNNCEGEENEFIDQFQAAIAKAEGGTP